MGEPERGRAASARRSFLHDAQGSAKYEKNSQSLVVTLPVKASAMPLPARRAVPEAAEGEDEAVKEAIKPAAKEGKKEKVSPPKPKAAAKSKIPTKEERRELLAADDRARSSPVLV